MGREPLWLGELRAALGIIASRRDTDVTVPHDDRQNCATAYPSRRDLWCSPCVAREALSAMQGKVRAYVAGPYSKGDKEANARRAIEAADRLLSAGFVPFIPHLTHFWEQQSPKEYETWLAYDLQWLACCEYLVRLSGESRGADLEEAYAREHGIPVFYGLEEFLRLAGPG